MRTIHVNSNKQPVDIERIWEDEDCHHRGSPVNDGGLHRPLAQRIEHPHLTGK
jgi:hypothetical protein